MPFDLRPATLEDTLQIARVHISSWQTAYRGLLPDVVLDHQNLERREMQWRSGIGDPSCPFVVAEQEGEVCGFVRGGPLRDPVQDFSGELYALYTLERVQGQGLGRALFAAVRGALLERNYTDMALWVLRDNPRARGFYAHLGGTVVAEKLIPLAGLWLPSVAYGWRFGPEGQGGALEQG